MSKLPANDVELATRTREALRYLLARIGQPIAADSDHFAGYIAGFCPAHRDWYKRHGVDVTMGDAEYVATVADDLFVEAQLVEGVTPREAADAAVAFAKDIAPTLDSDNVNATPLYAAAYARGAFAGFGFGQQFGKWFDPDAIAYIRKLANISDPD